MNLENKKIYISVIVGIVILVAVVWLIFRACSTVPPEENRIYYIARDSTWYPIDLRGKEKNMVGFANDMMQAIAENQEFRVHVFEVGPNALFDSLNTESYDAVLSSLTPTILTKDKYEFSDPFYLIGPVLIVPIDSEVRTLEDMEGKIMGIESGAFRIFNIPEPPGLVTIPYDTGAIALENLDKDIIDGVIMDALRAHVYADGFYAGRLKVATSPLTDKGLRLVTRNEPQSILLISRFNAGLKSIKEKGTYSDLIKKWELINTEINEKGGNQE